MDRATGQGLAPKVHEVGHPSVIVPDHRGDVKRGLLHSICRAAVGNGRRNDEGMTMHHYYAVAEPDDAGGYWISFPGRDGIGSAATSADQIVPQARRPGVGGHGR
jgi:hypothetical protein